VTHAERGHVIASRLSVRLLRGLGVTGALAIALVSASAASSIAYASCTGSPASSPNGFTGTVIRIGPDDRQAFVQKDDGTLVEVDGGTIGGGFSGEDYTFVLGGHYRIEPENSKPPFLVNDCTATTRLDAVAGSPSPASTIVSSPSAAPATAELTVFPTSAAHPDFVTGAIFIVIFLLLLAFTYAVRVLRRRRHRWD
jgi:hypothetical protein